MSFSKAIKAGEKPKAVEDAHDVYRGINQTHMCAYPSCPSRKIERSQDAVFWGGVHVDIDEFNNSNLSPMARLAATANPTNYVEKWGNYNIEIALHAECAAEWGMHLIKDALGSHNVGTKLRKDMPNAIRKQT
jgi:hypothetical protein